MRSISHISTKDTSGSFMPYTNKVGIWILRWYEASPEKGHFSWKHGWNCFHQSWKLERIKWDKIENGTKSTKLKIGQIEKLNKIENWKSDKIGKLIKIEELTKLRIGQNWKLGKIENQKKLKIGQNWKLDKSVVEYFFYLLTFYKR